MHKRKRKGEGERNFTYNFKKVSDFILSHFIVVLNVIFFNNTEI